MSQYYLTVRQAAEFLGCSPQTITRLIRQGHLVAMRIGVRPKSPWRIAVSDLTALQQYLGNLEPERSPRTHYDVGVITRDEATEAGIGVSYR